MREYDNDLLQKDMANTYYGVVMWDFDSLNNLIWESSANTKQLCQFASFFMYV